MEVGTGWARNELAEGSLISFPSGAKARVHFARFMYELKLVPFRSNQCAWTFGWLYQAARRLSSVERKAFADFVASAVGREKALVEKEFAGDKPGEVRLPANLYLEFTEAALLAFGTRQRDVGLVSTQFGDEAARLGGCGDALL